MSALETARKEWRAGTASRPMHTAMALTEDGLVLGSGTVLANTSRVGGLALVGAEQRVLALLSVAYRKSVDRGVLDKVRLASEYRSCGEKTLALIALAQTGLPRLHDPEEAAFRLFLADRALANGVSPDELIEACSLAAAPLHLGKAGYNPDQPRVPAGSQAGGQWTSGGDPSSATDPVDAPRQLPALTYVPGLPRDAVVVMPPDGRPIPDSDSDTKKLMAPPRADFRQVYAAGRAIASLPISEQLRIGRAAIGQGGTYDFQRDILHLKFYHAYIHAANYAAGVYAAGAGHSLAATLLLAKYYAYRHSNNYQAQDQEGWIRRGWNDAHSGRWK